MCSERDEETASSGSESLYFTFRPAEQQIWAVSISPGRIGTKMWERDWQTGERPGTQIGRWLRWAERLALSFLSRHQYSAHILLNTANGASDDWQDWVCRHTELNYPQNEATSPESSSPTRSLRLLHFICVLSSIRFASPFPVLKIYDILWFNNWIAFKTRIMRM